MLSTHFRGCALGDRIGDAPFENLTVVLKKMRFHKVLNNSFSALGPDSEILDIVYKPC